MCAASDTRVLLAMPGPREELLADIKAERAERGEARRRNVAAITIQRRCSQELTGCKLKGTCMVLAMKRLGVHFKLFLVQLTSLTSSLFSNSS